MGYSTTDNMLYAIVNSPSIKLIRISATGQVTTIISGLPYTSATHGDVDKSNVFWYGWMGRFWVRCVISSAVCTSGSIPQSNWPAWGMYDWAYVPGGGDNLYAISVSTDQGTAGNTYLSQFGRSSKFWQTVGSGCGRLVTGGTTSIGTVYASTDGYLYRTDLNLEIISSLNTKSTFVFLNNLVP